MANSRALTIQGGGLAEVGDADALLVGSGIDRATAGAITIGGTTATSLTVGRSGVAPSLPGGLTVGGGAIDLDPTGTYALNMDLDRTAIITAGGHSGSGVQWAVYSSAGNNIFGLYNSSNRIQIANTIENNAVIVSGTGGIIADGQINTAGGLSITGGILNFDGSNIDLDPTGNYTLNLDLDRSAITTLGGASGPFQTQWAIQDSSGNDYVAVYATGGLVIGNSTTNLGVNFSGTGTVAFGGLIYGSRGLQVVAQDLTFSGANINLDPTGTYDLSMDATQAVIFNIGDNTGNAFLVRENLQQDNFLWIDTTNAAEKMEFGNTANNPTYRFLGSGEVTVDGDALTLTEQTADPGATANAGKVYTKDVSGTTELFYQDSTGAVRRLTNTIENANNYIEAGPVSTTSVVLTDITGLTFTITLPTTGRIHAIMTFWASSTGANNTGAWAININSVDGTQLQRFLSGTNDDGIGAVQMRSAVLTAGTYTVKGRWRRVSGTGTLTTQVAQLYAVTVDA